MSASIIKLPADAIPTIPGTPFGGGFYVARYRAGEEVRALIRAPKKLGFRKPSVWSKKYIEIPGANSFFDGRANTIAMADAGLSIAKWALDLSINGEDDWSLAARDQAELCYRYLKPTAQENWTWRNGENPCAIPATYPYTATNPAQTDIEIFQAGGAEAFDPVAHWTSSQSSASNAWCQGFVSGGQFTSVKVTKLSAFAVRSILIIQ